VVGDINTTGVQNLALKIRGDQLYFDFYEKPELCRHLMRICADCIIQLFKFNHEITGTGAVDVTPMCDPKLYVFPNCTAEQISLETYVSHILEYDNQVADACHPVGIHHCGSVDEVLDGYAKVRHMEFIEIGFGSDVKRTREVVGPHVAVNARISPVLMKNGTPEEVAAEVRRLIDNGAPLDNFSIDTVGLTYGTPDENVRTALKTAAEYGKIEKDVTTAAPRQFFHGAGKAATPVESTVSSRTKTVIMGPSRPLVIIGERINPTGRKTLAESLEGGSFDLVRSEAILQVAAGAHILDVNVGVSGIDEPQMLKEAILAIQDVTDVPLCIDSALPQALEAGLSVYKGKALVNSVNGETHKLEQVLPLVKAHNAAVIGLTMDDNGIPKEAQTRLEIARIIVDKAQQAGIPREDVIIDPLAMAVSADDQAGLETLRALQLIRDELGVNQTLGLSNISFGLPERSSINAIFLAMAVLNGLTCPIADPTVWEMGKAVLLADLILGRDEFCMNYLSSSDKKLKGKPIDVPVTETSDGPGHLERIKEAVISGKRKSAVDYTKTALEQGADPREIINGYLIPGLNIVGEKFEKKKIFVPEMMMAAKSMQACVDLVTPHLKKDESTKGLGTIVLGTVFGDLHDIGKNLTKLLLETSGFNVIDLGENVPAQKFVDAARENNAHIVGLSSLLTTGDPHVEETIIAIKKSDLADRVKVICGGAALTPKFVEACGADAHARDAADGVKKIKNMLKVE
jgi:methanogenic corrinoid protein MtbC1